jgi:hypothetical protein
LISPSAFRTDFDIADEKPGLSFGKPGLLGCGALSKKKLGQAKSQRGVGPMAYLPRQPLFIRGGGFQRRAILTGAQRAWSEPDP